ncbi:MAG: ArsR/SmtB family transcription factor [Candidatus Bathyarchaeota archaeon]
MNKEKVISEYRVRLLNALADPLRLEIVEFLKDGERCVCEIIPVFGRAQSTISKHLDILYQAGILDRRVEGKRTIYSIKNNQVFKILKEVDIFILNQLSPVTKAVKLLKTST